MRSTHWSDDRFWLDALDEFYRRNESADFNISIDMKQFQKSVYSSDGPAYKLLEGMCSVKEHEGSEGYKGAPRLLLGLLTILDKSAQSPEAIYSWEIPKLISQAQNESAEIRRAVRLLQMISELHKAGYQRIRIAPGLSPSGCNWRCNITTVDNIQSNGWEPIDWNRGTAFYSSGQESKYFDWDDAPGKTARQLAHLFIDRFPDIAKAGIGIDYEYVGWYQTMLGEAEQGNLPCFFADFDINISNCPPRLHKSGQDNSRDHLDYNEKPILTVARASSKKAKIELYVRHSSNGTMLNFYLSPEGKECLQNALLDSGHVDGESVEINLELSVRPDWITDSDNPAHLRIPISALNLSKLDE